MRDKLQRIIFMAVSKHSKNYVDLHNPCHRVSSYNDCLSCAREVSDKLLQELNLLVKKNPELTLSEILEKL